MINRQAGNKIPKRNKIFFITDNLFNSYRLLLFRFNRWVLSSKSAQGFVDCLRPKFSCRRRDALIGSMNDLCKVEIRGQGHWQNAIGLNAKLGEEARISHAAEQ